MNGSQTPLALANLVSNFAAELQFDLEDAKSGPDAARATLNVLNTMWKNNMALRPNVEVI
jgi:hypothetical protein